MSISFDSVLDDTTPDQEESRVTLVVLLDFSRPGRGLEETSSRTKRLCSSVGRDLPSTLNHFVYERTIEDSQSFTLVVCKPTY